MQIHTKFLLRTITDINNMEIDITLTVISLVLSIFGFFGLKLIVNAQNTGSKYLKNKMKEMEDLQEYQKKMIQHYKNKVSNAERPPQIEGNIDELGGILPELIGQFSEYLPKWAQPLLKDKESQKWIMEYIEKNPEKAKEWFGKLVGKKGSGKTEESTDDMEAV